MNRDNLVSAHYVRALIETIREPLLILDSGLRVVDASPVFYDVFQVSPADTQKKMIYELGNGQWNIPALKKLLEDILLGQKIIKDYEVSHNFESIGPKIMLLNANQVDSQNLILVAFEDVTKERELEKKLSKYTKNLEIKIAERTKQLASQVKELEKLNETMTDRELKMVDLKKEIEELKNK